MDTEIVKEFNDFINSISSEDLTSMVDKVDKEFEEGGHSIEEIQWKVHSNGNRFVTLAVRRE